MSLAIDALVANSPVSPQAIDDFLAALIALGLNHLLFRALG